MDENLAKQAGWLGILGIVLTIVTIITGGIWRTEVNYIPTLSEHFGSEVSFEESMTARHWLFGLVKGKQPDLQEHLAKYLRAGERITQLTITTRHTFTDNLVAGVTLLIYCPVTVDIRGKVGRVTQTSLFIEGRRVAQTSAARPGG